MRCLDTLCSRRSNPTLETLNPFTGDFEGIDYSNPLICHGKGSGGGTNTVTSSASPPPQVLAAYQTALNGAQSAASQPLQQYNGATIAGFTPDQTSAFGTIDQSQGAAQPFINQAQSAIQSGQTPLWNGVQQFSPSAVNQYTSPYTQNVLNTTMASEQNQDAQQQTALQGNTIASGAWGGDRAGVASAVLSGQQALANNQTNANIENTGYNTALGEFNTQQQSQLGANEANAYLNEQAGFGLAGLGTEAQNTALTGASAQLQSGALQQQLGQEALNVPYEQFQAQQAYPFQTAQYFSDIAEGLGGGSGGTSSTTSPAASSASQIAGLGIGGLSLLGASGAFTGATGAAADTGWLSSLFAAARGGRIHPYARGGKINNYDSGGIATGIPDLSISVIPSTTSSGAHGNGIPTPPKTGQQPNQNNQATEESQLLGLIKAFGGGAPPSPPNQSSGLNLSNSPGADATTAMTDQGAFLGAPAGGPITYHRGGLAHFDDGGQVGGQTPTTAQTAVTGPMTQTYNSSYQNMTPQQLQQVLMRLPSGSPQQRAAQTALQQKRTMPNVGVAAQGGFNPQSSQIPAYGGYARGGFADGGDTDPGISLATPPPPDQDELQRSMDLGDLPSNVSSMAPVSASSLAPPGGFGTGRMTASSAPPSAPSDDADELTGRTHTSANPWMSLAKAGFAMAAGNSPHALQNIGAGAEAGISDYENQQKESDTVNQGVDKLLAEAKQHRQELALEQQRESDTQNYRQAALQQGKYTASRDPNTGDLDLIDTKTGQTIHKPGSMGISGGDLQGLTGQPFLDTLATKNPAMAAQVKAMDQGDLNFPTGFAAKAPYWQQRLNALYQYNPEASQQTAAAYKQFMSGPLGNTTRSLDVATAHINLAQQLIDAMNNGDTKQINSLANQMKTELGLSTAPTNLDAVKQVMAGEITKASTGASGALGDRDAISNNLSSANSPALLKGALQTYEGLMGGQLKGLKQQYEAQTNRHDYEKFLFPETVTALQNASNPAAAAANIPPSDKRVKGQSYTNPHGVSATWDGTGWVQ